MLWGRNGAARALALTVAGLSAAGAGVASAAPAAAAPDRESVLVRAAPGQADAAASAIRAAGHRVDRRSGAQLQVAAGSGQRSQIARLPGVAHVEGAPAVFPDATAERSSKRLRSQGILRSGATAFLDKSGKGAGMTIAVLDLGFGRSIERFQAAGELPPASRLVTRSFDPVGGLAGANAYGNPTNHGELVAQTVFDYAPNARYIFANYRTQLDFDAAVTWLIQQRPDIVVHSNSILEGPFDGTGPYARKVNEAAAAGILWFNSAGNYAQRHWEGPFSDPDGDGAHNWPHSGGWIFFRPRGKPISFAVSWNSPPGATTDLDMALEVLEPGNTWRTVAESRRPQGDGALNSERITGYAGPEQAFYRLRVWRASGPAPVGNMTLFSREIPTSPIGGTSVSSQPTPGDATGAISVGAVDWRGDALKDYSSNGPTDDGRVKPDLVASTNTRVAGPRGPRAVGGTSNAAPNAAGAAAVLLGRLRRQGLSPTAGDIRTLLMRDAIDLGEEGHDNLYGAGRVRIDTGLPRVTRIRPKPRSDVSGVVRISFRLSDKSPVAGWRFLRNGKQIGRERKSTTRTSVRLDTRRLEDGWHRVGIAARDWPGNVRERQWPIRVDNTPPAITIRNLAQRRQGARSQLLASVRARDAVTKRKLRVRFEVKRGGRTVLSSTRRVSRGNTRAVVGSVGPGRYVLVATAIDRAGNERSARRAFAVGGA